AIRQAVHLADELIGFPRHLSQHVGGFVLTRGRLDATVPIGNAAMDDRTFIEWDKDDIDTLGLMKVDVLALGMLSCLRRGLDLLQQHYGKSYSLATLPQDDPAVYEMLSRRFRRRVPGRKPRADVDAAAIKAALLLRPGHRSGDRAPGADPGRHGASLSAPARRHRPGTLPLARSGAWTGERAGRRAQAHARRAIVPRTGDADRDQGGEVHARRSRRAAPRHGDLPPYRQRASVPREVHQRHDRPRLRPQLRRKLLRPDRGLR